MSSSKLWHRLSLIVPSHNFLIWQIATKYVKGTAYCDVYTATASSLHPLQIILQQNSSAPKLLLGGWEHSG